MLAWCLSGHLCCGALGVSVSVVAWAIVIFISRLSCFHTHRKKQVLATPSPWVTGREPWSRWGR